MAAAAVVVLLALVYWVAKPADESVTVIPAPDGHIGTVVVQRGSEKRVLDKAYATSRNGEAVTIAPAAAIKETFGTTLQAMPAPPAVFRRSVAAFSAGAAVSPTRAVPSARQNFVPAA